MVEALFIDGRIYDLILLVLALEGGLLWWHWRRTGLGERPSRLLPFLLSGGALVAAFRASSLDAPWPWIAGFLACAFAAHALELHHRWRRRA
ncbi:MULTISPECIES: hypothetical protein [Thalassobaculum]|uniref:Uncharacterized protein n=1 Tax=Thalassobaculum litoreum DSM 18839 TaxID=1123362 RepID=A0A8G2BEY6_9PROT|nr:MULTISPECIES: hypothetical protein [Thalassobaculum]SDF26254.1 hypothetical protein SAMN05660686_00793 [Thalassobaculum litoreum DSM 18839]